jgi:malate dehydrogenase
MVDAIVLDQRRILPCAALCQGEYGIEGLFVGVPIRLGAEGIEEIVEIALNDREREDLGKSADAVRELVDTLARALEPGSRRSGDAPAISPRAAS